MAENYLTHEHVQAHFRGGPTITNAVVFVIIAGRMYKREGSVWRLLDDRTYASIKEFTDGSASG